MSHTFVLCMYVIKENGLSPYSYEYIYLSSVTRKMCFLELSDWKPISLILVLIIINAKKLLSVLECPGANPRKASALPLGPRR